MILATVSALQTLKAYKHLMYRGRTEASVITDLCWLIYGEPRVSQAFSLTNTNSSTGIRPHALKHNHQAQKHKSKPHNLILKTQLGRRWIGAIAINMLSHHIVLAVSLSLSSSSLWCFYNPQPSHKQPCSSEAPHFIHTDVFLLSCEVLPCWIPVYSRARVSLQLPNII